MAFTAKDVQALREKTGCGMMDCKKALTECNGDMEAAADFLREKGLASQAQKASRIAAIGVAKPVSINVNTFGTGVVADEQLEKAVEKVFDLRPTAIINSLGLRRPIYRQLAAYGHMGREDLGVSWEKTDKVDALLAAVK